MEMNQDMNETYRICIDFSRLFFLFLGGTEMLTKIRKKPDYIKILTSLCKPFRAWKIGRRLLPSMVSGYMLDLRRIFAQDNVSSLNVRQIIFPRDNSFQSYFFGIFTIHSLVRGLRKKYRYMKSELPAIYDKQSSQSGINFCFVSVCPPKNIISRIQSFFGIFCNPFIKQI